MTRPFWDKCYATSGTSFAVDVQDYYTQVKEVYDSIAEEYDATVAKKAVSRRAKRQALDLIIEASPSNGRLLEIGCYTGEEALILARKGYQVLGTDISPRMVEIARRKAERLRLSGKARFLALSASDLSQLSDEEAQFDTVYSVYGTLNLEPRLDLFKEALGILLKPGGSFVCGLLNPTVLYELLIAPLIMKFHGYRKLSKKGVLLRTGLGSQRVRGFLYGVREFAAILEPEFILSEAFGVHFLYPPPRGRGSGGNWWAARALDRWELSLQRSRPFRDLGFFSLLSFRRV